MESDTHEAKTAAVNFKLPTLTRAQLMARARADHRTLSSLMTKIIADYLAADVTVQS